MAAPRDTYILKALQVLESIAVNPNEDALIRSLCAISICQVRGANISVSIVPAPSKLKSATVRITRRVRNQIKTDESKAALREERKKRRVEKRREREIDRLLAEARGEK